MIKVKKKLVTPKQALEGSDLPLVYEFKIFTEDGQEDQCFSIYSRSSALETIKQLEKRVHSPKVHDSRVS